MNDDPTQHDTSADPYRDLAEAIVYGRPDHGQPIQLAILPEQPRRACREHAIVNCPCEGPIADND